MAKYDQERLDITPRFVESIKELMKAEMEMMREHEPRFAYCWTWGKCTIGDISTLRRGLQFEFGSEEDKPAGFPEGTDVWVVDSENDND